MRHRYIFCGLVNGEDKISNFRLISSCTKYSLGQLIRVNIPDDLKLNHYSGDSYSTTNDNRTLDELGYDCYIFYKSKWRKFNALKKYQPCDWFHVLEYIYGLHECFGTIGWTDSLTDYTNYYKNGMSGIEPFKSESEVVYPQFKEDQNDLNLPINLADWPFPEPTLETRETWFVEYKKLKESHNNGRN